MFHSKRWIHVAAVALFFIVAASGRAQNTSQSRQVFDSAKGIDVGYDWGPRAFADVNGDRKADFCRFVGDPARPHIACMLAGASGFGADQYEYRSAAGIDRGYDWAPRAFVDVSGDRRADFCRFVGDPAKPHIACMIAGIQGFNNSRTEGI